MIVKNPEEDQSAYRACEGRIGSHGGHGGHGLAESVMQCLRLLLFQKEGVHFFILAALLTVGVHSGPLRSVVREPKPLRNILRALRGLRAMILSDSESCSDRAVQDGSILTGGNPSCLATGNARLQDATQYTDAYNFFLRRYKVAGSTPSTAAASSTVRELEITLRICSFSISSSVTLPPTLSSERV